MNRCSAAARVTGPTRAEPGLASDCSAAAWLTTSPTAPYSTRPPPPMGPSTAGPVSTPIRSVGLPPSMAATAERARKAARTARSGSSSCASGAPNTAWSPWPDTDVTVPPSASTSAITAARQRPTASRRLSGSSSLAGPGRGHLGGQHAHGPQLLPRGAAGGGTTEPDRDGTASKAAVA